MLPEILILAQNTKAYDYLLYYAANKKKPPRGGFFFVLGDYALAFSRREIGVSFSHIFITCSIVRSSRPPPGLLLPKQLATRGYVPSEP